MPRADATRTDGRRLQPVTFAIVAAVLLAWEVAAARDMLPTLFFPPPSAWVRELAELWRGGTLPVDLVATLRRFGTGMGVGVLGGWLVGLGLGIAPRAYRVLDPIIAVVHPLPKLTLYPLLLLILGFGETPKVAVIAVATFFPMFVSTVSGVREVDPGLREVVRSFRAGRLLVLRRVVLPSSVPFVLAGLRLALNTGLTVTVAVELITAGDGLGSRIWLSWQTLRTEQLYAVLLVVAAFGFTMNEVVEKVGRRLAPWRTMR